MFRKSLSVLLSLVMLCCVFGVLPISVSAQETEIVENGANIEISADGTQSMSGNFSRNYTLTDNGANDIVAVAQAQNNRSQGSLGYTEGWCADFTSDCARLAGQESKVPFNGGVANLYNAIINAGGWSVSSPQKGDIAFFNYDHVGIMVDSVNCISGNMWDNSGSYVRTYSYTAINPGSVKRFLRPNYSSNSGPSFTPVDLGERFYANIIHSQSGKAVVAVGDNAGDNVQLGTLNGTLIQKWEFVRQSDTSYKIINNHSGKCLDVDGCSSANNTNIHIWDNNDSSAQLWYIREANNGYSLVPKCALESALDLKGGNIADGTNIEIYAYQDRNSIYHSNQSFHFNYLPSFPAQNLGTRFLANIIHSKSGRVVVANGKKSGDNVELRNITGDNNQKWEFIRQNDWSYKIINCFSGKCLDVDGCSDANNTNIHIWDSNGSFAQLWYLRKVENGYVLVPKCALNSALDLKGGNTNNGTNIEIYTYQDSSSEYHSNQVFALLEVNDLGEHFLANIIHTKSGNAVVVAGNKSGDNVELDFPNHAYIQKWEFIRQADWSYKIINSYSGKCLDVDGCASADNTNVHVWDTNNSLAQLWYIRTAENGYSLVPKCALNSALDLKNGDSRKGANLEIFSYQNSSTEYHSNQTFSIINAMGEIILGDVDVDGEVEIRDSTWIQRHNASVEIPFTISKTIADVDGDGIITVMDATAIQYYLANMKTTYKIGEKIE